MLSKLAKVVLPEGLESIGENLFGKEKLKEVTIPKSVKTIEGRREYTNGKWVYYGAFSECKNLQRVVFKEGSELKEL